MGTSSHNEQGEYELFQNIDALLRTGKFLEAVILLKKNARRYTGNAYFHYLLGVARMKCGWFLLAREALEEANRLWAGKPENLRTLGWIKVLLGDIKGGRKDIREAISKDLMYAHAYVDLAMSYIHYFEFKEGLEFLKTAKALAPQDSFMQESVHIAREMQKDFSRYSKEQLEELRKQKLDSETQRQFRISFIEQFLESHPILTSYEAEEVAEEMRRNGMKIGIERIR